MGLIFGALFLLVGLLQITLGLAGIEYMIGWWASLIALVLAFAFRFMLPLSIGSYFGAVNVMDFPWWVGVLVVLPGLLFLIPAWITIAIDSIRGGKD